ncbi:hypothetical protein HaLaN_20827 [Haematococcus lacustris]|uniref:Uncharacterized protein n=1 Tax=Haematococcus lacustris TaxID=44745 RepID=A0A699ZM52_HAELA|nr:hypothetical protein HaLaN_20827 [Haematococcus lacustris]
MLKAWPGHGLDLLKLITLRLRVAAQSQPAWRPACTIAIEPCATPLSSRTHLEHDYNIYKRGDTNSAAPHTAKSSIARGEEGPEPAVRRQVPAQPSGAAGDLQVQQEMAEEVADKARHTREVGGTCGVEGALLVFNLEVPPEFAPEALDTA